MAFFFTLHKTMTLREEGRRRITLPFSKIVMTGPATTTTAIFFLLTFSFPLDCANVRFQSPTANLNTTWINDDHDRDFFGDANSGASEAISILGANISDGTCYALGFYCKAASGMNCSGNAYLLAIFIMATDTDILLEPQAVWSANRDHPVRQDATVAFTSAGDLSLWDADRTLVWSTNTSGKGVHTLSLHPTGNLVLADAQNGSIWESFDHPADTLVLGQTLKYGARLIAGTSLNNSMQGPYYMQMDPTGLTLYLDDPVTPQPYLSYPEYWPSTRPSTTNAMLNYIPCAVYRNGSLDVFISNLTVPDHSVTIPPTPAQSISYLQLGVDGTIHVYSCNVSDGSCSMLVDLQAGMEKTCSLPTICGPYGICNGGECSCLQAASATGSQPTDGFSPVVNKIPSLGCASNYPLVCNASTTVATHHFLRLDNYYYPNVNSLPYNLDGGMPIKECQQRCLENCSCAATIFQINPENQTVGTCFPISRLYTITQIPDSVVLIRMQSIVTSPPPNTRFIPPDALTPQESPTKLVLNLSTIISVVLTTAAVATFLFLRSISVNGRSCKRREEKEDEFETVPGLQIPMRFSFKELKAATKNFSKILGAGGFGSVFLGALPDGSEVAVKRLESANQGQKEFHTEVCIIGSIHHVNLVRLRGFCAENKHRLLVYEYMQKGSLEKWLFRRTNSQVTSNNNDDNDAGNSSVLDWDLRFNIALGTARGLAYLHEGCSERIIHLDIKPPNILLDNHFVAKVSDFGLSKLMNREQSQVVTTMRGTPGYLAPEWLHASVTEKADVYSFGILLFEIASGRKSVDMSVEESEVRHIPVWASRMVEEGRLMDVIDARLLQEFNCEQAETMVKVALWCIQENPTNRPSMGIVVQMLEGVVECPDPPLNVSHPLRTVHQNTRTTFASIDSHNYDSSKPLASILSSPR